MSQPVEFKTKFSLLTPPQKTLLMGWRENVNEDAPGPRSLWVYGERGSGSSYIGITALHKMVDEHREWDYEYYKAQKVMAAMKNFWDFSRQLPTNDDELMREYLSIEEDFRYLWEKAEIIFIDDLHHTVDLGFWRRHIQEPLEMRVKEKRPTIIAGSVAPDHAAFADITRVIENHFVVVHATR